MNAGQWKKLMDLYIENKMQSLSLCSLVLCEHFVHWYCAKSFFFLPNAKQNNFHGHSCNSSNVFVGNDARKLDLHYRDLSSRVFGLAS